MKAMVLAAGLGTRLRPLTNDRPKALVDIDGRTLLEITLARLRSCGIREVIVNAHHFAEKLIEYLQVHENFGMQIEVSREHLLLDTGGGLKKAAHFFAKDSQPFLLHNVDVLSSIDLAAMLKLHQERNALATLAVQDRRTSRYLLFDNDLLLCGRVFTREGRTQITRPVPNATKLAFCGIHILSPAIFQLMQEDGVFSIIDTYLRLSKAGERVIGFRADESYWRDLGKPENIAQAAEDIRSGVLARV